MDVVETECTMASLTIEMHMGILVMNSIMAETKLVPRTFNILDGMDKMMILESGETSKNSGLVDRSYAVFQLHHAERTLGLVKSLSNKQPVCSCLDSVLLKEMFNFNFRHTNKYSKKTFFVKAL